MQCILVLIEILISFVNHIFFQNSISFLLSKWPSSWVSKCFCQRATLAVTEQFEGRTSYVMWLFWDMLHSTDPTNLSYIYDFFILLTNRLCDRMKWLRGSNLACGCNNSRVANSASKRKWAPQTTRDSPKGVQKPSINEIELSSFNGESF